MAKPGLLALIIYAGLTGIALAQGSAASSALPPGEPRAPETLLRSDHITATGATVPLPGRSQSAGQTELDRNIERKDTAIQNSICKGC